MIVRIVKMQFRTSEVEAFKALFETYKSHIASQEGCMHLELLQDTKDASIFMTYSHWEGEQYLDQYRHSDLFGKVWPATKALFASKPQAWSLERKAVSSSN